MRTDIDTQVLDLLSKLLDYEPDKRLNPMEALLHPFFDDLYKPDFFDGLVPNKDNLPKLFYFSDFEKDI